MCDLCRMNPNTHSFDSITEISGIHVFYTSFRNLLDYSNFTNVRNHIEGELALHAHRPWAWIIDCKYLESKHMFQLNFAILIVKYLRRTHTQSLVNIYLLNGGLLMGGALKALSPFIDKTFYNSILLFHGTRLDLLRQFQGKGWTSRDVEPLMVRLAREYS